MPPWPAEEFLRRLVVFSEKQVDWAVAKTILQDRIRQRLVTKKTKKVPWLIARNISSKNKEKPVAGQQQEEEVENEPAGQVAQPSTASESTAEGIQSSETEAVQEQGPIPHESSAVPPGIAEDGSGAGANLDSSAVMEDAGGERVDDGRAKEAEAGVAELSRKYRRLAVDGVSEEKRRRLRVTISVVNLDLEEGVEELKSEAHREQEKDDALLV